MKVFRAASVPLQPADPNTFSGIAHVKRLAEDDRGVPVGVYRVEFSAGARTNWHKHSGPQWLFVVEGRVRVQRWGEPVEDVVAGDAVAIGPARSIGTARRRHAWNAPRCERQREDGVARGGER